MWWEGRGMRLHSKNFSRASSNPPNLNLGVNGNSEPIKVDNLVGKTVAVYEQTSSTLTATVQVQGRVGSSQWINIGDALTAAGFVTIAQAVDDVRVVVSGYSAGDIRAKVAGYDARAT